MHSFKEIYIPIIAAALILGAGCVGPADSGNRPVAVSNSTSLHAPMTVQPATTPAPATLTTPAPVPTICPQRGNESFWISLEPVADLHRGDLIEIRGETNLPEGKTIDILILESSFHPHCKCCYDDELITATTVYQGIGCNRSFAITLDSANLRPQEFLLMARYGEDNEIGNSRIFTIFSNESPSTAPGERLPANTSLNLDPVRDVKQGEMLVITGFTGNPAAIRYSVRDDRYTADLHHPPTGERVRGTMYPFPYEGTPRPFAFRFNTSGFAAGRYVFAMDSPCTGETAERTFTIVP
jgi:hypothetical protein